MFGVCASETRSGRRRWTHWCKYARRDCKNTVAGGSERDAPKNGELEKVAGIELPMFSEGEGVRQAGITTGLLGTARKP